MRGATIRDKHDYLRADVLQRQNAPALEKFLRRLKDAAFAHPSSRVLIYSHVPRATSKIDRFHASYFLDALAARPALRVALVATHREVQLVQQYIEALARMKKANLRSFASEPAALAWLITPVSAAKRPSARSREPTC